MQNKIWIVSDLHLCHQNIIKYCNRPFTTADEMNSVIINNWNNLVGKEDLVYNLGDFVIGSKNKNEYAKVFDIVLNGNIVYLKGNHDSFTNDMFEGRLITNKIHGILAQKYLNVGLSHYPPNKETKKLFDEYDIILHGHVHNSKYVNLYENNAFKFVYNCCLEANNYSPILLDDIIIKYIERISKCTL